MGRRGYPPEFRRRVLDLVEAGRKVAEVADYEQTPFCNAWWEIMSRHERLTTPEGRCRGRCWESRVEFRPERTHGL